MPTPTGGGYRRDAWPPPDAGRRSPAPLDRDWHLQIAYSIFDYGLSHSQIRLDAASWRK